MKLAIRIFALFVVVAGAAAATSSTTNVFVEPPVSCCQHARYRDADQACPVLLILRPATSGVGNDTKVS